MKRPVFPTEAAYPAGLILLAFSAALMDRADFGLSMVVAPAKLLSMKLSSFWPWFSFGTAEYCFQALLLLLLAAAVRRFRLSYLFSFVTAVIYGFLLDGFIALTGLVPAGQLWVRLLLYVLGVVICSFSVSLLFHTYIPPEVYELFVSEVSARYGFRVSRCKTVYDLASLTLAVGMSFLFFGRLEAVGLGTFLCALVNGFLIGRFSALLEKRFDFRDRLPLHRFIFK